MVDAKIQRNFFLGLFLGISILAVFVFLPFLKIILFSAVISVVLHPLYEWILKACRGRQRISAALVILITAVLVLTPAFFLGVKIFNESRDLYLATTSNHSDYLDLVTKFVEDPLQKVYPEFSLDLKGYITSITNFVVKNLGAVASGAAYSLMNLFLIAISLFFFLKDGPMFKKVLISLSPLDDSYDQQMAEKVGRTINSVIRGALFVALIQGALVGLGLLFFHVPNSTLWGSLAAFAALIPGLGTALVVFPAVIYLYFSGQLAFAIGLALWGVLIVGLVDNFLTPYFYGRGSAVHPLAVLFSVLGGLVLFGPVGFIFGPIILTLLLSLLDIYRDLILKDKHIKDGVSA